MLHGGSRTHARRRTGVGFGGEPAAYGESLGGSQSLGDRARVFPELDMSRLVVAVDADVRLHEPRDEHRRHAEA